MTIRKPVSVKDRMAALVTVLCVASMPVFAQAQDDSAQINPAIAQGAVLDLLPDFPMKDGLSPEDYVSGNDHTADTRRVTVQIGPDGQIMPGADWQKSHPDQCRKQARETNAASQRLTFEVQRRTESLDGLTRHQYFATVRVIDEASNIVKKKADGTSTVGQITQSGGVMENPDNDGVPDALGKAMQALGVDFGAPTDGCGDFRLVHQFGSMVDEEFGFVAGYQNASAPNMTYEWSFGGGSGAGSGSQLGRHTYTQKGTYTVTVHVSGEGVRGGSASITVAVNEEEEEAPIQPRDGAWTVSLINHETQGCAPRIAAGVESAMDSMIGNRTKETLAFETPFHPRPLMKHDSDLAWEQTGTNTWKTVVADKRSKAMSNRVVLEIEVISPTLIKEVLNHNITMSETFANLLGGSAHCLATGNFDVTLAQ